MTRYRGHPKEAAISGHEGVILSVLTCTCISVHVMSHSADCYCYILDTRSTSQSKTPSFTDPICQHKRRKDVHKDCPPV